jgi:hypothetical protein
MTQQVKTESQALLKYFFLWTFAWAWAFFGHPADDDTGMGGQSNPLSGLRGPLLVTGAYAPFVSAFALSLRDKSAWTLFKRAFRWRMPPPVLLSALFLSPVLAGVAVWIQAMLGGPTFSFRIRWQHAAVLIVLLFFLGGSFNEEFGWAFAIAIGGDEFTATREGRGARRSQIPGRRRSKRRTCDSDLEDLPNERK